MHVADPIARTGAGRAKIGRIKHLAHGRDAGGRVDAAPAVSLRDTALRRETLGAARPNRVSNPVHGGFGGGA
jgi:hypothetical protein